MQGPAKRNSADREKRKRQLAYVRYPVHEAGLASSVLAADLIGALCFIPLINLLDSPAEGILGLSLRFFLSAVLLASFGLPASVSEPVSRRSLSGRSQDGFRVFLTGLCAYCLAGAAFSIVLCLGADFIAARILAVPECAPALRLLSPCLFFCSAAGVLQGYFQGLGIPLPAVISRNIGRIAGALAALGGVFFLPPLMERIRPGSVQTDSPASLRAAGAALGYTAACAAAALFLLIALRALFARNQTQRKRGHFEKPEGISSHLRAIAVSAGPVLAFTALCAIHLSGGLILFIRRNRMLGLTDAESLSSVGMYTLKYGTFVLIPVIIAGGLGAAAVPGLASACEKKDIRALRSRYDQGVRLTSIVSLPAFFTLSIFASPLMEMLFQETARPASLMLLSGSPVPLFFGIIAVSVPFLQLAGHFLPLIRNAFLALISYFAVLCILMFGFQRGAVSLSVADTVFAFVLCILNHFTLKRSFGLRIRTVRTFIKPAAAAVTAGTAGYAVYLVLDLSAGGRFLPLTAGLFSMASIYTVSVLKLGTLSKGDILLLPGGERLLSICRTFRLLPAQHKGIDISAANE